MTHVPVKFIIAALAMTAPAARIRKALNMIVRLIRLLLRRAVDLSVPLILSILPILSQNKIFAPN
jgi:hypothetical protein